jgi:hypothetical protein
MASASTAENHNGHIRQNKIVKKTLSQNGFGIRIGINQEIIGLNWVPYYLCKPASLNFGFVFANWVFGPGLTELIYSAPD